MAKIHTVFLVIGLFFSLYFDANAQQIQFPYQLSKPFLSASASIEGNELIISTGEVSRIWKLTEYGLLSLDYIHHKRDRHWPNPNPSQNSDWNFGKLLPAQTKAQLKTVDMQVSNDEGFTGNHLLVSLEFEYPAAKLGVKYVVWAYPDAPGLRTQLFLKGLAGYTPVLEEESGRVENLSVDTRALQKRLIGYFNDTQHRNTRETEILQEEMLPDENKRVEIDWASALSLEDEKGGLVFVKESHKCVNQKGVNTGGFVIKPRQLEVTGMGLNPSDIRPFYQPCWATWSVLFAGKDDERELALKVFDRIRYPVDPGRDMYIMANTWGSTIGPEAGRHAARESNILEEIKSQQDLGIDVQQIDDGWQGTDYDSWRPVTRAESKMGKYEVYPEGWGSVKQAAEDQNIRLGLWAAWSIPGEDLYWNYQRGNFKSYKLDFARLDTYDKFHNFINKIRNFVLQTGHDVRVNWDVTENPARIGYFFGREYGNIYLENRKPIRPAQVVYQPYLVLRDAWQVSKYVNLNKFQVTVQNIDQVNQEVSDAYLHNHPYCVAISLMASPIFFQETHYYNEAARKQIRPLLKTYKAHREAMYQGYVFPIGEEPDNASWPGFQNHNPKTSTGYLTIFREIGSEEKSKKINLRFIRNQEITLENLLTDKKQKVKVNDRGEVLLKIEKAADFRFYRYGY